MKEDLWSTPDKFGGQMQENMTNKIWRFLRNTHTASVISGNVRLQGLPIMKNVSSSLFRKSAAYCNFVTSFFVVIYQGSFIR
jgi:hypothetical protein